MCYPELEGEISDFPCNEWIQSSNFAEEIEITEFEPVALSFTSSGIGGDFGGLGVSPPSKCCNLIDDLPNHGNWFYSVGTYSSWGKGFPGPHPQSVKLVNIYLAACK